jgi:hypothetical protein
VLTTQKQNNFIAVFRARFHESKSNSRFLSVSDLDELVDSIESDLGDN